MFDHKHYVPILKGRAGELAALKVLGAAPKASLTPLIEVPPVPWDFGADAPAKTLDEHLRKLPSQLKDSWGTDRPLFVDLLWIDDDARMANGAHPLVDFCARARAEGLQVIPVTGLRRPPAYQAAVKTVASVDQRGACIRFDGEDFEDVAARAADISQLLSRIGVAVPDAHAVLDFGALNGGPGSAILVGATSIVRAFPFVTDWRTLTFAATAFPENLGAFGANTATTIPRAEFQIWSALVVRTLPRIPTFGDYAIAHPDPSEVDPRFMQMSANLRYTIPWEWLIFKARTVRRYGFQQFNAICAALLARPEYAGASHCWGDLTISQCATNAASSGNATTWRKIGTVHHLTRVTEDIATASVP